MDKKIEAIEKSQDVKSEAIKLTTSMQLAVNLAIAEYANPKSLDTLETLITKYRKFILTNWEVDSTDVAPFKLWITNVHIVKSSLKGLRFLNRVKSLRNSVLQLPKM